MPPSEALSRSQLAQAQAQVLDSDSESESECVLLSPFLLSADLNLVCARPIAVPVKRTKKKVNQLDDPMIVLAPPVRTKAKAYVFSTFLTYDIAHASIFHRMTKAKAKPALAQSEDEME